jgi:hypothetical protein
MAEQGLWRHQTGWIFFQGYGPIRLWTRAAPPLIRFARRRLREICRSLSLEHVVTSAFVLKRRIRDVIAPLPTKGVRKEKSHTSRNPPSRLGGFSNLEKSTQFSTGGPENHQFRTSRNPPSFRLRWIFIHPVFDWVDLHPPAASDRPKIGGWLSFVRCLPGHFRPLDGLASAVAPTRATRTRSCSGGSAGDERHPSAGDERHPAATRPRRLRRWRSVRYLICPKKRLAALVRAAVHGRPAHSTRALSRRGGLSACREGARVVLRGVARVSNPSAGRLLGHHLTSRFSIFSFHAQSRR